MISDLFTTPQGWEVSHIIRIGESWEVIIQCAHSVVTATGETIEDAIAIASERTDDPSYVKPKNIFLRDDLEYEVNTPNYSAVKGELSLESLGLARPQPPIARRKLD